MNKKALLNKIDETASGIHLSLFGERPGLSTFLFHSIFRNWQEISKQQILPQEHMTVDLFREFLDYFLSSGYHFVSPDQIRNGLKDTTLKYGLITFDDGYFNNTLITDTLAAYQIPAVFFISTAYIQEGKKFWSDALYHERKKKYATDEAILREIMSLKHLKVAQVEDYLVREFGTAVLKPLSDTDRPMTPEELGTFAAHPFVHLGNHTHQHEILTNLSEEEIMEELRTSQQLLHTFTGQTPYFISYPNGSYSDTVLKAASDQGFTMGITTIQQKNLLPLKTNDQGQLLLHRFNPVAQDGHINCRKFRSSLQLKTQLKKWLQ
jgi:peptidoglycan/xylan/chitin deacetylase (PgdA/CDA1 family)